MEPGFTSTEYIWMGIVIAVVINLMYQTEPNSREPDPFVQYGAYRSYGKAIALTAVRIGLLLSVGAISVFYLGWLPALYLLWPVSGLLGWITWKYFRSTATLPPEIASGLVFLNAHQVHWAPSELKIVVNGWGIFGGLHATNIDAALTDEGLYLHFDVAPICRSVQRDSKCNSYRNHPARPSELRRCHKVRISRYLAIHNHRYLAGGQNWSFDCENGEVPDRTERQPLTSNHPL